MKKVALLAVILAALVTILADTASWAAIGKDISRRGNSDATTAPRLGGSFDENGQEYPVERIVDPAVASQEATAVTSDLAVNPGADDRKHLAITAQNMNIIGEQVTAGKIPEDQLCEALDNEVQVINQYLVERKIIRQELTPSQLLVLLRKLGYWGGASWGKASVDRALREKLLVGRTRDATSSSNEWKQWLTREEFAVGLTRTLDQAKAYSKAYTDQAIGMHKYDRDPHPVMRRALEERIHEAVSPLWFLMWILLALIALALLYWLFQSLWCRRAVPTGGYPTTAVVYPVVPGAGPAYTPPAGFGPPFRNNTGMQHIP